MAERADLSRTRCVECGGSDLKALKVLYEPEEAKHPSERAKTLAPPTKWERDRHEEWEAMLQTDTKIAGALGFLGLIAGIAAKSQIAFLIGLGVLLFRYVMMERHARSYRREIARWNAEEYPKLLEEWEHSAVCTKCGRVQPTS